MKNIKFQVFQTITNTLYIIAVVKQILRLKTDIPDMSTVYWTSLGHSVRAKETRWFL